MVLQAMFRVFVSTAAVAGISNSFYRYVYWY